MNEDIASTFLSLKFKKHLIDLAFWNSQRVARIYSHWMMGCQSNDHRDLETNRTLAESCGGKLEESAEQTPQALSLYLLQDIGSGEYEKYQSSERNQAHHW